MAGYVELREGRKVVETDQGVECEQSFVEKTGGADSLPAIGDAFSVTTPAALSFANSVCKSRDFSYFWYDHAAAAHKQKIICRFSTRSGASLIPDSGARRYSLGGEVLTIPNNPTSPGEGWIWALGGEKVKQPIYQSNIMGSFTAQKELASDSAKATWMATVEGLAGKINTSAMEGHRVGSVLFSGVSGGTQQDETGGTIWLFECEFTFRIINGLDVDGNAVTQDDWLYLIDRNAGGAGRWDKPQEATSGRFLYEKANLSSLL
jgi:hypothetical protein